MVMRRNKCPEILTLAADIHRCSFCRDDGTANEIPKDLPAGATMEDLLVRKEGLAARFIAIPAPAPAPVGTEPTTRKRKGKSRA